jgi:hypothetical protein
VFKKDLKINKAMETIHFASVTLGRARNSTELHRLLDKQIPESENYLVKPNWYSPNPANYTDSKALTMLLDTLDGHIVVTEGHSGDRQNGSMHLVSRGEKVDWRWLLKHPEWSWAKENDIWNEIKRQDKWFLDNYGFTDVINEHDAEYVNITDEIWSGRTENPEMIKTLVESRFTPVLHDSIYSFMPNKLWSLRGSPLISYGRVKSYGGSYPSLTLKNLFGFIPDPYRSWWHGPKDRDLNRNIVDIVKLYAATFQLFGICEAYSSFTVNNPNGKIKVPWGGYDITPSDGVVAFGPSLIELDAVLCSLINIDSSNVGYLELGCQEFGTYDKSAIVEAAKASADWFPINR